MSLQFKKLVEGMAKQLGYTEVNRLGSGHLEAIHPNGAKVRLPFTPKNEWREKRNARAVLERAAGQKLPRSNSGKAKGARRKKGFTDTGRTYRSEYTLERDEIIQQVKDLDAQIRSEINSYTDESYEQAKKLLYQRSLLEQRAAKKSIRIREFRL